MWKVQMGKQRVRAVTLIVLYLWGLCSLFVCGQPEVVAARGGSGHPGVRHHRQVDWPARAFAPYDNDTSRQIDLVALSQASGARFFTLAFIESAQGKNCRATWNTRQPIGAWLRAPIEALRAAGGDVRVAFGGSANAELAAVCATLPGLEAQYQAVVDAYSLTHLDFDIEGKTLRNTRATDLRNQAIAALQQRAIRAGRRLSISYTLPVETTGLNWSDLNLLRNALRHGVRIDVINLMAMDYYSKNAPGAQMGQNALATATSVFHQLQALYPTKSAAQLWGMLGLTPMIGVNDNTDEIFTLQDAQTVLAFAIQQHLPLLAFWSTGRDRPCTSAQSAPHGCSGVVQRPYDYARAFALFES